MGDDHPYNKLLEVITWPSSQGDFLTAGSFWLVLFLTSWLFVRIYLYMPKFQGLSNGAKLLRTFLIAGCVTAGTWGLLAVFII